MNSQEQEKLAIRQVWIKYLKPARGKQLDNLLTELGLKRRWFGLELPWLARKRARRMLRNTAENARKEYWGIK
jgi:hypothetical protein